jgi:hypothetical protein
MTDNGICLLYFTRRNEARVFCFGGRLDLAESYTKSTGVKCPDADRRSSELSALSTTAAESGSTPTAACVYRSRCLTNTR